MTKHPSGPLDIIAYSAGATKRKARLGAVLAAAAAAATIVQVPRKEQAV